MLLSLSARPLRPSENFSINGEPTPSIASDSGDDRKAKKNKRLQRRDRRQMTAKDRKKTCLRFHEQGGIRSP